MVRQLFDFLVYYITPAAYVAFMVVFFIRLQYIRKARVLLWGLAIFVNYVFVGMAAVTASLLGMEQTSNVWMFTNVLLLLDMAFWLLQYRQHVTVSNSLLWGIFGVFFVVWCGEFALNIQQNGLPHIERLRIATLFIHVVVVTGCWFYLVQLFRTPFVPYRKNPFFWLVLGWLFSYTVTSTTLFTGLLDPEQTPVLLMYNWAAFAEIVSHILYIIGFWKTKNWVIRHQL